jgi:hypothetical protein
MPCKICWADFNPTHSLHGTGDSLLLDLPCINWINFRFHLESGHLGTVAHQPSFTVTSLCELYNLSKSMLVYHGLRQLLDMIR